MKILILGGTGFVGLRITEAALAHAHDVTLFNRGLSNPKVAPQARRITGDRQVDVSVLGKESWDCVIDVNGYLPGEVRASATALQGQTAHYIYISTVSVYPATVAADADEAAPLLDISEGEADSVPEAYGAQKANCERALQHVWEAALTIVRPTFVVGADDPTDRFTYWVRRLAQGGRVVVPAYLDQAMQLIDARDLADFTLLAAEETLTGVFNAAGPAEPLTMHTMFDAIATVTATPLELVPVTRDQIVAAGTSLPLTVPRDAPDGMLRVSHRRGVVAGLQFRPLATTIRDTWEWDQARGLPPLAVGPDAATEQRLLEQASPTA